MSPATKSNLVYWLGIVFINLAMGINLPHTLGTIGWTIAAMLVWCILITIWESQLNAAVWAARPTD